MAKDKKTIRFWLRTDRRNQDTSCPIHVVYQIKGVRKVFAIPGTHILPSNWDVKKQVAVYCKKEKAKKEFPADNADLLLMNKDVEVFNGKLTDLKALINDIETRFRLDDVQITPQLVIAKLKVLKKDSTKKEDPSLNIADFINDYVAKNATTHRFRTLQVYGSVATHIKGYEKKYNTELTFENIDIPRLREFVSYLLEPRAITLKPYKSGKPRKPRMVDGMNNVTIAKQIGTLKTLLRIAKTVYKLHANPEYQDFRVARKDSSFEVVTLTNEEFLHLFEMDLNNNTRLDQVRDIFCFSCATGLRYSDLAQLKRDHIRHNVIRITASKTGQRLEIPLNPFSVAILQKYQELHSPLPMISGQKMNTYLKELGKLAGIDAPVEKTREYGIEKESVIYKKYQLMSVHMGRRTFTTLSLEKGMAPQEVMSLTGHTTFKAFKRYVDVTNDRKKTVMAQAWGEVKDNNLKVV